MLSRARSSCRSPAACSRRCSRRRRGRRPARRVRRRCCSRLATLGARRSATRSAGLRLRRGGLQHVTDVTWISELGIHYKLGVDGLNLFLILLTALLWVAATAGSLLRDWERPRLYYLMLALGETAVLGAFCAQDLALFVLFFDLMLVPFYFLIGIWGGPERVRATTTFVIYTLVGSLLMLAAAAATGILATPDGRQHDRSSSPSSRSGRCRRAAQEWIFLFFAAAFLVKMPAFPLHGVDARRLPQRADAGGRGALGRAVEGRRLRLPAHRAAAVPGRRGAVPGAAARDRGGEHPLRLGDGVHADLGDARRRVLVDRAARLHHARDLLADRRGRQGAVLQMVNHGLVVAPLFFIIALLAARAGGTDDLRRMGGLALRAPVLAALFLIVALATLAMPGLGQLRRASS